MLKSFILVLVAACFVAPSAANRCFGRPDGTFINDFTACDTYFVCTRQTPVLGRCPQGFYFNEAAQKCDHPWNVICLLCVGDNGGDEPDETEPTNDLPVNYPIDHECRMYTACADDEGFLRECAPDLMFNPATGQCDLEENVDCEQSVCPSNVNPSVPTFVPDLRDCARYYICFNRTATGDSQRCAGDLLFNPETRMCDLPENVECDHIVLPPIGECPPTGMQYIPVEDSCTSYYVCVNGDQRGPVECADGLIFDILTRSCRIPSDETQCMTDEAVKLRFII
ncbi:protein obstructor-E-like [Topomyia yanbarensis]|uniref:protein obstructor-E-like n=1 Tax=Topomyia yanbarensis TaxID=2498891 RepID=UPI00273C714B|nr:protein obstructor-E-like [Topomyia yanbarensis]